MSQSNEQYPSQNTPFDDLKRIDHEQREAQQEFKDWCDVLMERQTPVDVEGFPAFTTMNVLDEDSGEILRRVSIPTYSLLETEKREPRKVLRGRVVGVSGNGEAISVATSERSDARIYNFNVHNIQQFERSADPDGRYVTYQYFEDGTYQISMES